ncbi:hypothetical protein [Aquiflexum lacus]|uniref:hypothetical protein n=1 Tax=Aquiflexum lacus TaxID=2483805 RepID=UPI0018937C4D|nr:hypothetical protein [Aquiflexum lacus]
MKDFEIDGLGLQIAFNSIQDFALSPRRQERSAARFYVIPFLNIYKKLGTRDDAEPIVIHFL